MEYLLLGMGKSNLSLSKFFELKKIKYVWYDDNLTYCENIKEVFPYLKDKQLLTNDNKRRVVIKSGGVKNIHPLLKDARIVISDLEFYYLYNNFNKKITVTGTNGKTTCVSLVKELVKNIEMGGNIGIPLGDLILSDKDIVIEASSYMLEHINLYHSKYNVLLNISPNHLDHHDIMENYISAKMKLFKNCNNNDYVVYNYDDSLVKTLVNKLNRIRKVPVSLISKVNGIYLMNDYVYIYEKPIMHVSEINLEEVYLLDALAAIMVSYLYGVSIFDIRSRLKNYHKFPYRLEEKTYLDYTIYNDSKATNINAMYEGLKSIIKKHKKPVTLICGGMNRNGINIYDELVKLNFDNLEIDKVICFGEARLSFKKFFENKTNVIVIDKLKDFKIEELRKSKLILFSPGCPSYDEFINYEKRGEFFDEILKKL